MNLIKRFRKNFKNHPKNVGIMLLCIVSVLEGVFLISLLLAKLITENLGDYEVIKISLILIPLILLEYILASILVLHFIAITKEGFRNLKKNFQKGLLWQLRRGFIWALVTGAAKGVGIGFGLDVFKKVSLFVDSANGVGYGFGLKLGLYFLKIIVQVLEFLGLFKQSSSTLFVVNLSGWIVSSLIFWFVVKLIIGLKAEFKKEQIES